MKIAVVTGASSGMGREFARQLAVLGEVEEIWAIARNADRLSALEGTLAVPVRVLPMDVSDMQAVEAYRAALEQAQPEVAWLVNSAGFGKFCDYLQISMAQSGAMIDTNCKGLVAMTLATLPHMHEGAHIVNLASASAFQPLPWINIYGASKAFVRNYSRALNRELKRRKITVTAVCPYWVRTNFFDTAHAHEGAAIITKYEVMYEACDVVKKALRDAGRGRDMSVYGARNKFQHVAAKLLPQRVVMNIWQHRQKLK